MERESVGRTGAAECEYPAEAPSGAAVIQFPASRVVQRASQETPDDRALQIAKKLAERMERRREELDEIDRKGRAKLRKDRDSQLPGMGQTSADSGKVDKQMAERLAGVMRSRVRNECATDSHHRRDGTHDAWNRMERAIDRIAAEKDREAERLFADWLAERRVASDRYVSASRKGIATDHFGKGGDLFRWALESVSADEVLRPSQKDEALRLAIEQLNALGQIERLSGFGGGSGDPARTFTAHAIADLGRTLRRLAAFGAVCRPTAEERPLLAKAKAQFEAQYD